MICVVYKELKINVEKKKEFQQNILSAIYEHKKQELNLSIDGFWKDLHTFVIIERWSTKDDYEKFVASEIYKNVNKSIIQYTINKPYVKKYETSI
ncbi:antibiotic biosynthesis monooxygenase [Mycoplasma sp. 744]|uniref:putative quinol monooxygenase n=1 Tax=unclassified Mycoplasma TaxID=2683645 RepID=UPI00211D103E|nr:MULTISPECIES: antibiotic biosynthesis monooxygenase [unclassified Mycoplasma]MEA4115245.1 antibiotic biosynthesis monooxygenase [Mycoplasma sp. 744]UUM19251.1 antibiotic biosynthesis monooxygenase [Mycoplasma sp. 1018B]